MADSMQTTHISTIKLPSQRKRKLAAALLGFHNPLAEPLPTISPDAIRVVCISDTHNHRPELPPGDLLIHAGDLTENGSFDEVQTGLAWLSAQPHRHKVFVAGNHDVLLDEAFLEKHPERRYGQTKTKNDLDWGDVTYLEDTSVTLDFPSDRAPHTETPKETEPLKLTIFGSPWTPQYGLSAFQYPRDATTHWQSRLEGIKADIVVTHGPPRLHLDRRDFYQAGCAYLGEEVARMRPQLMVFGHIHAAHGREDVVLDAARAAYERVENQWDGWGGVLRVGARVVAARVGKVVGGTRPERVTTFVNGSAVGGPGNELRNGAVVVEVLGRRDRASGKRAHK